ncbi:MAG: efflux RND transporter periplasmic adaptor subunit [Minwuiales bacterium]|nr:efflux RND transporter periplasmic adaptor subunit [Minwuiales bacterium]
MKRFVVGAAKLLLPLLILAAGAGGFVLLVQTRPQLAPNEPQERVWVIGAETARLADIQPQLRLFGEVVAGRQVELRALVAGEVVEVAEQFREGGYVEQGELLVQIDPFDYQATLDEQTAQLQEARARLDEIEARRASDAEALARDKEMLEVRERDLARVTRLFKSGNVSEKSLDEAQMALSLEQQSVTTRQHSLEAESARTRQQKAAIARLEVAVRRAERDLRQTRLAAPFSGFLSDTEAEVGRRLSVNDRVAELIEADYLEARVHLSDAQYGRIVQAEGDIRGRAARVYWRSGGGDLAYRATVERIGSRVDATTGGVDIYARLTLSSARTPIRPGAFVEVQIADRLYPSVIRLPETVLYDDDTVYVVNDGRLARRKVEIAGRDGNSVLLRGDLKDGEQVVVTRFTEIGPGVAVEVR